MSVAEVHRGSSPVILAFPQTGTDVPDDIAERLNGKGRLDRDAPRAEPLRAALSRPLQRLEALAPS